MSEVILIDDGRAEGDVVRMVEVMRRYPHVRMIRLSRSYGASIAILAGLDTAIGERVIILDADSDPLSMLTDLARNDWQRSDVLVGRAENPVQESRLFRLCRSSFFLLCRMLKLDVPPTASTYYCLSRRAVNAVTRVKQRQRHLSMLSRTVGFPRREFTYRKEYASKPKPRGLAAAVELGIHLLLHQSRSPLRLVSGLGLVASGLNLLYVVYIFVINLVKRQVVEGWTTLSLQTSFMFLFVFLILTILSECVSRILQESGSQPLYHVLEECGSTEVMAPKLRNVVAHALPNSLAKTVEGRHGS
jgi:dolichol-phosphate mannosyltransferase